MYYKLTMVDAYIMNAVVEGYRFDEGIHVPDEFIEQLVVWEALWFLVPAFRILIRDPGGGYLDYRHLGNVVVKIGLEEGNRRTFDMAVADFRDTKQEGFYRPSAVSLGMVGMGMLGAWLLEKKNRAWNNKSASEVAQEVVNTEAENYRRVNPYLEFDSDVDRSADRRDYLQLGTSNAMFLSYLVDSAFSGRPRQHDFFTWIESGAGDRIPIKFYFKSFSRLEDQEVSFRFQYTPDHEDLNRAMSDNGYMDRETRTIPLLWFQLLSRNSVADFHSSVIDRRWFDLKSLSVKKERVSNLDEFTGGKTKNSIVSLILKNDEGQLSNFQNEGTKHSPNQPGLWGGRFRRTRMLRKLLVAIPGCTDLRVGQKVRVIMPTGYGDMFNAISGDWIIGELIHLYSALGRHYFIKAVLVSSRLKSEVREA